MAPMHNMMHMGPRDYHVPEHRLRIDKTYRYVYFMDREHPLGDKKGRVLHHRHVASVKLGRWVSADEVVHHVDHDRSNNVPENLDVMSREAHAALHADGQHLPELQCPVCLLIFIANKREAVFCSLKCSGESQRRFSPSRDELEALVSSGLPVVKIAKIYGVSDRAVHKRIELLGIAKVRTRRRAA